MNMKDPKVNSVEILTCNVKLLDDTESSLDVKKNTLGQVLVDHVCKTLDLVEKDYFGLRYVDNKKQRHWLDTKKEISKQLKDIRQPFMFFFRVKFYPTDPTKVKEDITRYQVYLQLKRDILHGRLLCPFNNITNLAAHIVQSEVGDYNELEHGTTYINGIKLLPRHSERLEEKIIEYHKTLAGYFPLEAEIRFLDLARAQDLYGVDPHPCKDPDDLPLYLGLTPAGIQIIREARRVSGFSWKKVHKISYVNKLFYVQVSNEQKKTNYSFRLNDAASCKHLWKCTMEHMAFYNEEPKPQSNRISALSPQSIFRRSKYKFKGKTENEILTESELIRRAKPPDFERKSNLRLSVHLNCAKNSYSLPNLKSLSEEFPPNNNDTVNSSNCSTDDERQSQNSTSNLPTTDNEEENSALAEFVTSVFPTEMSSSRSSILEDNVSIDSNYELTLDEPTIPEINVEEDSSADENNVTVDYLPPVENETVQVVEKTRKCISTRMAVTLYKEPYLLLLLLLLTAIPMAILLQMVNNKS